jgi:hypothetical protein
MDNVYSSPSIRNVVIRNNYGTYAGGMYNLNASPIIINTVFWANSSTQGAGMYNNTSNATVTNCTFYGNSAFTANGGIYSGGSNLVITNTIFWANTQAGSSTVAGADIGGGSHTVTYSITQQTSNHSTGTGIINNQDPLFVGPSTGDFSLPANSPAVNTGNNFAWGNTLLATDIVGNIRPQDVTVDIGAYEYLLRNLNSILYVNKEATGGGNNGNTWADAFLNLQDAIDAAAPGNQVWVAAGTYYPSSSPDGSTTDSRNRAFHLIQNYQIYGGFAGTETLLSERDFEANETILSGDFNNDDEVSGSGSTLSISNNTSDNAYHVVAVTTATSALLDGFTIKGGNANGSGILRFNGNPFEQSEGGGIYVRYGKMQLSNLKIIYNAADYGGGVNLHNNAGSPLVENVKVLENVNDGLRTTSPLIISNSTFSGNKGRGVFIQNARNSIIRNSIFSTNSNSGFASFNSYNILTNNTFYGNTTTLYGGGIYTSSSTSIIKNCIFWNNTGGFDIDYYSTSPSVQNSLTQQGSWFSTGTGIVNNQNPLFVDAGQGDFRLLTGSPALDAGNNTAHYRGTYRHCRQ